MKYVFAAILTISACASALAQSFHGGVRGSVRDVTGVISATSLELREQTTGLTRTTVTNDKGEYAFADVLPGTYEVTVSANGFKTNRQSDLRIDAQTFMTLDVTLQPGDVAEVVTVTGHAPQVEQSNGSVSSLLDHDALVARASAGRNVFIMATGTPTVIATGDARFVRQQDQSNSSFISIGGGPRRDNSYVLDGVPMVDILNRATFVPSFHAVEEMRVQVSAYDAQIGRTSGGVFNVVGRSGSNEWRGDGMFQGRPSWAQSAPYFAEKTNLPQVDTYYRLYGGGAGGPIVKNRTFFWASTEGYRSLTTRSAVMVLPTAAERAGDFSQSGITIFDPLTTRTAAANPSQFVRDPFPNNRIPQSRLNPVSLALLQFLPLPTSGHSRPATANLVDAADQVTGRVTHRWNDRLTTTGLYAWYGSQEPDPTFFGGSAFDNPADPGAGAFVRRAHTVALNNAWTVNNNTLVEARYGFASLLDDNRPVSFDPSGVGFSPSFLATAPQLKFPDIGVAGYGSSSGFLGDRFQSTATYYAHNVNGAVTTLVGRQTLKAGGEYRVTGVRFLNLGGMGNYSFSRDFTFGPDPNQPAANTGDAIASFLLGYPSSGAVFVGAPLDVYLNYWSGFLQDDLRIGSKLTVNVGMRYEFEQGLEERNNRIATGWRFDQPFPVQVGGTRPDGSPLLLTGGLTYAGVDGASTHQGHPDPHEFGPRFGVAYVLDDRTSLRGGYGLFWAPPQAISADETGTASHGYNQTTSYVATGANPFIPCATCSLTNPFPSGYAQPSGNAGGPMTGVGGYTSFIDPQSHQAHFHRYSLEWQRELPRRVVVSLTYLGMRGEDLTGGSQGNALNINQIDPKYLPLGTSLQQEVPNPFFGTPLGVGILATPSIARGQLLRPYPQFDTVEMSRPSIARSRYNAVIATLDRRMAGRWSAHVDYTWSRMEDSQYSESNFFSGGSSLLNNYDVERDFGLSALDTAHRVNLAGTIELPFGVTISAVGSYQSGFPVSIQQSPNNINLFGGTQRPNIVPGVNPQLTGDSEGSYDAGCGCIRWLNPAAWSQTPAFTFGNAPRTDGRVRTPVRRNWDVAIQKSQRVGRTTASVRAEIINIFNFADFRGPDISFGSPTFGQIRDTGGFPRMLQASAQLAW